MSDYQHVVWAEGVFLGQQHFQLWDRCQFQDRVARQWALQPFGWGLIDFAHEPEALERGELRVTRCELLLPDGRLVRFNTEENAPVALSLPDTGDRAGVFAGLPRNDDAAGIAGYNKPSGAAGWHVGYREVPDQHDATRTREVAVAYPNLTLRLDDEPRDQLATIKLAELVHDDEGNWQFDATFIPPTCQLGSSQALMDLLRRVEERIAARIRILDERRAKLGAVSDFGPADLAQFLLLHALRPAHAEISHCLTNPTLHPERLFTELKRLLAALTPFQPQAAPDTLPEYDHDDLRSSLQQCDEALGTLLSEAVPSRMTGLNLMQETPALRVARGFDAAQLYHTTLFLAIRHDAQDPSWVNDFARQVKIGSREDIETVMASALVGVPVSHIQRPPNRLPVKSGYEYFRIEPGGQFWERIIEHQNLAVFLPREFEQAYVEILTVEE
jgi:type VI secretion system protein ImpJ